MNLQQCLEYHYQQRNTIAELSFDKPDPLMIAKVHQDENIALICALFAYGKAHQIVKFLNGLNFDMLHEKEEVIQKYFVNSLIRIFASLVFCRNNRETIPKKYDIQISLSFLLSFASFNASLA